MMSEPHPMTPILLRGLPMERGIQHGAILKDRITANIEFWKKSGYLEPWQDCVDFSMEFYYPAIAKYFPAGLEEMKGIAQGCGRSLGDIIVLNSVAELFRLHTNRKRAANRNAKNINLLSGVLSECSAGFCLPPATKNGDVFMGHNFDNIMRENDGDIAVFLEVHPDPSEKIPNFFTLTDAGQLSRNGANANGLGMVGMWVFEKNDAWEPEPGSMFVPTQILRRKFIQSPNYALGLQALLIAPRHISSSSVVVTREGDGMTIELTPKNHYFIYPDPKTGIVAHSNRFMAPEFHAKYDEELGVLSSFYRDRRIALRWEKLAPNIDDDNVTEAFMDHLGWPNGVCMHEWKPEEEYLKQDRLRLQIKH